MISVNLNEINEPAYEYNPALVVMHITTITKIMIVTHAPAIPLSPAFHSG